MKNKYFINFIHGYFQSIKESSLMENYHLHSFLVAKQAGYNKFIIIMNGGYEVIQDDPNLKNLEDNYGIVIKIIKLKNIFQLLGLLFKYACFSFQSKVLIYFNSHNELTYLGLIFTKIFSLGRIKTIFMSHTQPLRGGLGFGKLKQFFQDRILFKFFVDRVRLNNLTEEKFLVKRKVKLEKLFVVPLVVDDKTFHKLVDSKDRKDLLFFGNITHKKNISTALKALREVIQIDKYKDLKLNIIGKETDYNLAEEVEKLNLEKNIHRFGFVPLRELNQELNRNLIYLNDSSDEGQCVATFDAALAGCALCLPNIMSFRDVFKDKAVFHEVGDYKKLAKDIILYLEDSDLREKYIQENIAMIKNSYFQKSIENKFRELLTF